MPTQSPTPLEWHIGIPDSVLNLPAPGVRSFKSGRYFYGETPNPTPEDGWLITGRAIETYQGVTIEELKIEPSPWIEQRGERFRRNPRIHMIDINSSVINLIDLTRIRDTIRRDPTAELMAAQRRERGVRLREIRRRKEAEQKEARVNTPDFLYCCAQDVLEEVGKGRGIWERLAKRWSVSINTVKFRMKLLRSDGWIDGGSTKAMPGPAYTHYEETLKTNSQKEET